MLTTGPTLGHFEIQPLISSNDFNQMKEVSLEKIFEMVLLAQIALPNQFITSNIAEVFNALHDRFNVYHGKKSFEQANRDVLAWAVMTFYPKEVKKLISRHDWPIPQHCSRLKARLR